MSIFQPNDNDESICALCGKSKNEHFISVNNMFSRNEQMIGDYSCTPTLPMQTNSCKSAYEKLNSITKALGFEHESDGQRALGGDSHYINWRDVEHVVDWLFRNGYDVVKLNTHGTESNKG